MLEEQPMLVLVHKLLDQRQLATVVARKLLPVRYEATRAEMKINEKSYAVYQRQSESETY
jgi:hypothetical protein